MKDVIVGEQNNDGIAYAMNTITKAIVSDHSYRIGWKANIAMAFKDEWARNNPEANGIETNKIHDIANKAADNFLDILCRNEND